MADGEVSFRPINLRPGGAAGLNPFSTFGKGAGIGLVRKVWPGIFAHGCVHFHIRSSCLPGPLHSPFIVLMPCWGLSGGREQPVPGGTEEEASRRDRSVFSRVPDEVQRGTLTVTGASLLFCLSLYCIGVPAVLMDKPVAPVFFGPALPGRLRSGIM